MPENVKLIKIFLASPGDVKTERNYVKAVVKAINSTVAPNQNIRLEVICSENAYPGFGKDGQRIINDQIGKMDEYDLFILIMKNRFGSPTKRCASGTSEEFQRAKKAHQETGKPNIWFYSGSMKKDVKKKEEKEQQAKVKGFISRFINNRYGLFKTYTTTSDFKEQLHNQLIQWLLNYYGKQKTRRSSTASKTKTTSPKKKESVNKTKVATSTNQTSLTSSKPIKERKSSTNKSKTTAKPQTNQSISSSGAWVLLDDNIFQSKSVSLDSNQKLVLHIPVRNAEQEANLRQLKAHYHYSNRIVSYSYQNDAFTAQVESVEIDSPEGKTSYIITLKPIQQSNNFSIVNYNGYSIEEIAELKIRSLLLNEIPKNKNNSNDSMLVCIITGSNSSNTPQKSIFSDIRKKWKDQPKMFLIHARLAAVHLLKSKNIVEHILKFKISHNKNVLYIDFSAKMQNIYGNQEQKTVAVKGECTL